MPPRTRTRLNNVESVEELIPPASSSTSQRNQRRRAESPPEEASSPIREDELSQSICKASK